MIYEQAHAKINLSLDITGKRDNGYHEVCMIMQTISICDDLSFEKGAQGTGVVLTSDSEVLQSEMAEGKDNLVLKAARLLFEYTGKSGDARITLTKRIPIAAGLAGGSADAAATLRGLNRLFEFGLSMDELRKIAVKIGADVPFCVEGGLCLCEGIGEVLTNLTPMASIPVVICKPDVFVSTPEVYRAYDENIPEKHPDTKALLKAIEAYDNAGAVALFENILEPVTAAKHPVIKEIEKKMLDYGAMGSIMSGSGPTVFGVFDSDQAAKEASERLMSDYPCFFTGVGRFHNTKKPRFE